MQVDAALDHGGRAAGVEAELELALDVVARVGEHKRERARRRGVGAEHDAQVGVDRALLHEARGDQHAYDQHEHAETPRHGDAG